MVTITLHCPHCQSDALVRDGHAPNGKQKYRCHTCGRRSRENPTPNIGSGSCEKDSPVEIIAMKKEQEASLMHDLRCAKRRASCAQNERDAAARCYSTARHGQFLPSLFPQRYAVPVGSPPDTLPR